MAADVSRADVCVVACADAWRGDGELLASPIGPIPAMAARLARAVFEPDLLLIDGEATLVRGTWAVGTAPDGPAEGWLPYRAVFDLVWRGRRHIMMGPSQIDRYGNANISCIGDFAKPKVQLLGVRGAPGNTVNHPVSYWVPKHSRRVFVDRVDMVSGVGYDRAAESPAAGRYLDLRRVVSNLGVFDFGGPDHRLRVVSVHPGVTVDDVAAATSFELAVADDLTESRLPTTEELDVLDTVIDPDGTRHRQIAFVTGAPEGPAPGAPKSPAPESTTPGAPESTAPVSFGFAPGALAVVTGAGSGIGRATALLGAAAGLDVASWDLDAGAAERTATEVVDAGGHATWAQVDVTDPAAVATGFDGLDRPARYLVNNAGPASAAASPFADGLVNGAGSMELVARTWLATEPPAGASLVNVASVAGNVIGAEPDWYAATKAAVTGYTRHLAVHRADRIRANAVAPGMVATPRSAGFADSEPLVRALARNPLGRMAEADEIAWTILFLLSPLASYVNGILLVVDGGWTIAP